MLDELENGLATSTRYRSVAIDWPSTRRHSLRLSAKLLQASGAASGVARDIYLRHPAKAV